MLHWMLVKYQGAPEFVELDVGNARIQYFQIQLPHHGFNIGV